jgi:hypothetical protein
MKHLTLWITTIALVLSGCQRSVVEHRATTQVTDPGSNNAVQVEVVEKTFAVRVPDGPTTNRGSGEGYYPPKDPQTRQRLLRDEQRTVKVVILRNAYVEAWVVPQWGARLIRAFDPQTQAEFFMYHKLVENYLPWNGPGGVKASFPFFEHGLTLDNAAAWRLVHEDDGGVSVAMDLRFTQFDHLRDITRYGQYSDESLSISVGLKPDSALISWVQRKDNLNPTPRSDRVWNDARYPMPVHYAANSRGKTLRKNKGRYIDLPKIEEDIEILYPATWAVDHGPTKLYAASEQQWDVSHFALAVPSGFVGAWYPPENLNRLRIHDPRPGFGPGAKVWNKPGRNDFEHWGGEGIVFEAPGDLRPAWQPVAFTHHFWTAQGIGRVSFANEHVAVSVDGQQFSLVTTRPAQVEVDDDQATAIALAQVTPHQPLTGRFSGKALTIRLDGRTVMRQSFPIVLPNADTPVPAAVQSEFLRLKHWQDEPERFEKDSYGRNQGIKGFIDGLHAARHITPDADPRKILSLARVCQRLGDLALAEKLAQMVDAPEADLVLGLIALERATIADRGNDLAQVDFGRSGWQADGLRALRARALGDNQAAITYLRRYLAAVPDAWYPRLWLAYWSGDKALAQHLAEEQPASPEAHWVLKQLRLPHDLTALSQGFPTHQQHLDVFSTMATEGGYRPLPRYPLEHIANKPW